MEIKKSSKADLDGRRVQGFLMGLILVLTLLFVSLEYDYTADGSDYDFDALENIVKELDLQALKEEEPQVELKDEIAPPEEDVELKTVDEVEDPEQPTAVDMELNPLNFRVVEGVSPERPTSIITFSKPQ